MHLLLKENVCVHDLDHVWKCELTSKLLNLFVSYSKFLLSSSIDRLFYPIFDCCSFGVRHSKDFCSIFFQPIYISSFSTCLPVASNTDAH